jgi:hypothetical protein
VETVVDEDDESDDEPWVDTGNAWAEEDSDG